MNSDDDSSSSSYDSDSSSSNNSSSSGHDGSSPSNFDSSSEFSSDSGRSSPEAKKRRTITEDRLSALPDSLIHHILSFLRAEEVVKTGGLSTRWRNLCTGVPILYFRYRGSRYSQFSDFISKTLLQYTSSKIKDFCLKFNYDEDDRSMDLNISVWLNWASAHNASVICLRLREMDGMSGPGYEIPQSFFRNSSMTKLITRLCVYKPREKVCWASIRSLNIGDTKLPSHRLQRILLGSPMLKSLELYNCEGLDSIDVSSSPKLKFLHVYECWPLTCLVIGSSSKLETLILEDISEPENTDESSIIYIDCPSLKTLDICGGWKERMCRLLNVSSLTEASLTFEVSDASETCFDLVKEMLPKIENAEEVTLGPWIIQALSVLEFRGLPSPWTNFNCQRLTLCAGLNEWTVFGIVSLLESLPTLQRLVLDGSNAVKESFFPNSDGMIEDFLQEKRDLSLSCLSGHLKTLEIVWPGLDFDKSGILAILQFLLKNAGVLEKMVFFFRKDALYFEVCDLQQKVSSFPRSSPNITVLIKTS